MDRRAFITMVGACIPAVPRLARAPAGAETKVIGVLSLASPDTSADLAKAGTDALRERGWVLGQNLTAISRYAYGRLERVPELAAELVSSNVDLLWTGGDFTIAALHAATTKIPIVFFAASDPVNSRFALTLARPGKNLTGVSGMYHELNAKRLELFHTAVPNAKRVAIIAHPNDPQRLRITTELDEAARKLQVRLKLHDVGTAEQIPDAFAAIAKEGADGLLVAPHPLFFFNRVLIAEAAAKSHLPAIYAYSEAATAGGLMSYASDLVDQM